MVMATECWNKSLVPLMKSVREQMGGNRPVYLTFDIDSIDPSFCPGTGKIIFVYKIYRSNMKNDMHRYSRSRRIDNYASTGDHQRFTRD